jgi:non-heme chloroperoxidase
MIMSTVTTKDGVQIFYKDWGQGQPIVFHHGWPLSSDDRDAQMLFFVAQGFRVVAHDRRGHGRSTQISDGHDMDHMQPMPRRWEHLNLKNAVHIGHSTGGGELARYVAKYGQPQGRVAKAVLVSAVPPLMVKTESNPGGTPIESVSMASARRWPRTGRSSSSMWPRVRSTASIGQVRRFRRASSRIGGARA